MQYNSTELFLQNLKVIFIPDISKSVMDDKHEYWTDKQKDV